jgi:hypothetical protein
MYLWIYATSKECIHNNFKDSGDVELLKMKGQLEKYGLIDKTPLPLEDLCPVDVWQKEIYSWYEDTHDNRVQDNDETFVYPLDPQPKYKQSQTPPRMKTMTIQKQHCGAQGQTPLQTLPIDVGTLARINHESEWTNELELSSKSSEFRMSLGLHTRE